MARKIKFKISRRWIINLAGMSIKLLRAFVGVSAGLRLRCVITDLTLLCLQLTGDMQVELMVVLGHALHPAEGVMPQHGFVWINKVVFEQRHRPWVDLLCHSHASPLRAVGLVSAQPSFCF